MDDFLADADEEVHHPPGHHRLEFRPPCRIRTAVGPAPPPPRRIYQRDTRRTATRGDQQFIPFTRHFEVERALPDQDRKRRSSYLPYVNVELIVVELHPQRVCRKLLDFQLVLRTFQDCHVAVRHSSESILRIPYASSPSRPFRLAFFRSFRHGDSLSLGYGYRLNMSRRPSVFHADADIRAAAVAP